jgi:hypothetical protein
MYFDAYPDHVAYAWPDVGKVDTVTESLLVHLEKDEKRFLQPLLSCMVRSSKRGTEGALTKISQWRSESNFLFIEKVWMLV